jgi:guanosine-3',5'-bis(diphosphate) 3'-pyrophosphohydrolase
MPGEEVSQAKQQLKLIIDEYLSEKMSNWCLLPVILPTLLTAGLHVKAANPMFCTQLPYLHSGAYAS